MTTGEVEEAFLLLTCRGKTAEETVQHRFHLGVPHRREELTGDPLIGIGAPAEIDLIAFFAVDLDSHQADVADVVLRAGVGATGDVEGDRPGERVGDIERTGELDRMALGVGCGKAAAAVAGAGDGSGEHRACGVVETGLADGSFSVSRKLCRDIGNEQVLPSR